MEYPKEYGIDNKCRYGLSVSVTSCRRCLFNTLCHLEHDKELREKEERENEEKSEKSLLDHNQQ